MSVRGTHVPEHLRLPIAGVTPPPTEKEGQRLFPTGNFRFYRPVYRDKTPPCNHACPTGEQIQKYLDHVKHDRYLDGYLTICEDNPMPSVTGRVCYHPCETACNRAAHDEPIGIRSVERFLGDYGLNLPEDPIKDTLPPLNGTTVAIVGSGPAGLAAAYHLRRRGYASVIFEALDKPGGMLRAGIPAWHLPEEILDKEIAKLLDLGGIEIRCGVRVGDDPDGVTLGYLRTTYDAVFLALGQDVGRRLGAEGTQARGVIGAMEFLRETGLGRPVTVGASVLVIGGGNTASDAARSAIRLGGAGDNQASATIVSLEAESELAIVPEDPKDCGKVIERVSRTPGVWKAYLAPRPEPAANDARQIRSGVGKTLEAEPAAAVARALGRRLIDGLQLLAVLGICRFRIPQRRFARDVVGLRHEVDVRVLAGQHVGNDARIFESRDLRFRETRTELLDVPAVLLGGEAFEPPEVPAGVELN